MNLEPETRNGYFISAEMKKVWAVEIQLLKKLLEVCEKHHLKIWAEGGTLLGTVRHHGYIPWDDDIDMAMLRDDYDKLQTIAKDEFKAPYFFQSGYTDLFAEGMSKLRMDNTTAIQHDGTFLKCHQGIFIDIFPMDKIPHEPKILNDFIEYKNKMKQQLMLFCNHHYSFWNISYNWQVFINNTKIRFKGFPNCYQQYDKYVKQYWENDSKIVSLISWFYHPRYVRDMYWYRETIYMKFEEIRMPIPIDYELILHTQFGDYMTPQQDPSMHGDFLVLDSNISYRTHLEKLRKSSRKQTFKKATEFIKGYLRILLIAVVF